MERPKVARRKAIAAPAGGARFPLKQRDFSMRMRLWLGENAPRRDPAPPPLSAPTARRLKGDPASPRGPGEDAGAAAGRDFLGVDGAGSRGRGSGARAKAS